MSHSIKPNLLVPGDLTLTSYRTLAQNIDAAYGDDDGHISLNEIDAVARIADDAELASTLGRSPLLVGSDLAILRAMVSQATTASTASRIGGYLLFPARVIVTSIFAAAHTLRAANEER